MDSENLRVRSHVGRDLLQSAGLFAKDKLVVWEYVSNGLQYVDRDVNPIVRVRLDNQKKRITIADNGRGMNSDDLQNFFFMHGENQDRKQGRIGRGMFGTGKSAAFGIGDVLRVTTVKDQRRSKVELSRESIEREETGNAIPVHVLEVEVETDEPNGTTIEVEGIRLKAINQREVISYIERHLARWSRSAKVFVNNHLCEFDDPPVAQEFTFGPEGAELINLGDVVLTIKVSTVPLETDLKGISIFSNGVWHETTLCGIEKDMTQYIFGELDVSRLDKDASPIKPFNVSRSMKLNPENDLVRHIYSFVAKHIEAVRSGLLEQERTRKADETARKLAEQAKEIAGIINSDFDAFRQQVAKSRARGAGGQDELELTGSELPFEGGIEFAFGDDLPADVISEAGGLGSSGPGTGSSDGDVPRELMPLVEASADASDELGQKAEMQHSTRRSKGGFNIEFRNHGTDNPRAQYVGNERTIYVNLDHPQLRNALHTSSVNHIVFKRLAYEVAFAEYAIALSSELATQNAFLDFFEPITEIRDAMNRIATKAAHLYAEV